MKQFFIFIVVLFFSPISFGQIGEGIVRVHFDIGTEIDFFSSIDRDQPDKHLEIIYDEEIKGANIDGNKADLNWLQPEALWLDYHFFFFRCVQQTETHYQVVVNKKTGATYWIEKKEWLRFQNWETFLKDILTISRSSKQEIKTSPEDTVDSIFFEGDDCFHIKTMKGDWIEITTRGLCNEEELTDEVLESGWIRWKDEDELLIDYTLTM